MSRTSPSLMKGHGQELLCSAGFLSYRNTSPEPPLSPAFVTALSIASLIGLILYKSLVLAAASRCGPNRAARSGNSPGFQSTSLPGQQSEVSPAVSVPDARAQYVLELLANTIVYIIYSCGQSFVRTTHVLSLAVGLPLGTPLIFSACEVPPVLFDQRI